jgi:hypothetical protein
MKRKTSDKDSKPEVSALEETSTKAINAYGKAAGKN